MSECRLIARGFTLIELLITVVIVSILLAAGIPSFNKLIRDNQTGSQAHRFIADLNLARSEAVKRGRNVFICKSTDQLNCTNGSEWEGGWIIFVDADTDVGFDFGPILRVNQGLDPNFTLRPTDGNFTNWIRYDGNGSVAGNIGGSETFELCRPNQIEEQGRQIAVSVTGRVSIKEGNDVGWVCP